MVQFWLFVLKCFYLMLPAYFANMAPVIVKNIDFLRIPVDFNKKFRNKPVLGRNKTFRGLFFGVLFAIVVSYFQNRLYDNVFFGSISMYNYGSWLLFGLLMGLGALAGDLAKSFFKRRLGINPGEKFVPFDQTDFVIGSLIFIVPVFNVTLEIFMASLILSFLLHIIVNHAAYYLGIRNEKW